MRICACTLPSHGASADLFRRCSSEGKRTSLDCDGRNYTKRGAIRFWGIPEVGVDHHPAHLTASDAEISVRIAGVVLPAKVLKQGSFEDEDLSLLMVDEEKLPRSIELPRMQLCEAPPWPGDPVIVVDARRTSRSHIVSPQVLPLGWRTKFSTLIADVATTGNSGSGVFDPNHKCLLGIMSRKFFSHTTEGDKDITKYFIPAAAIRAFMPAELKL